MTAESPDRRDTNARPKAPPFSVPVFAAALAAGLVGHFVAGPAGFGAAIVVALFGAVLAALLAPPASTVPQVIQTESEELAQVRERAAHAARELERARRHTEVATQHLRDGKDPLTEVPELRVGPLRELLEAAKEGAALPVVSRLSMSEEELIGENGEPLPVPWPAGVPEAIASGELAVPMDDSARTEAARELDALIDGLDALAATLRDSRSGEGKQEGTGRTPAQLVDAVVHTAADGIEDLAAGLMRANELAGVAERVTNKATLLALNAALEATRSGSEAFAAIAEETRRLAEFAREATDTISRLSSEIEYKVGETITAIHATSEDAKSAVASFHTADATHASHAISVTAVEELRGRAHDLKKRLLQVAA